MPPFHTSLLKPETNVKMRIVCALTGKKIKDFIQEAVDEKIANCGIELPQLRIAPKDITAYNDTNDGTANAIDESL
jgi:hypothetical protein